MIKEIERKFLVDNVPQELLRNAETQRIMQGYLFMEEGKELRIRKKGTHFFMTKKTGNGLIREELETPITKEVYDMLWPFTDDKCIIKTRYSFVYQQRVLELDCFEGDLHPLTVLEVEFPTVEEAKAYAPPPFVIEEITTDNRYKNVSLAINGAPK